MPSHTRTVSVPGTHSTDADGGVVCICDGVVVHVTAHAAVSTTCGVRAGESHCVFRTTICV